MHDDYMILSMRFPQKLWRIVNRCDNGAISWSLNGTSILLDYKKFQEQYLDAGKSIFKTSNITSFIRQLNLYGFRKVTAHNRDSEFNLHNPHVHEFLHENFQIGRPDLLMAVRRKTTGKTKDFPSHDRAISTNDDTDEQDVERGTSNLTRLEMCRLKLSKELEQIMREYLESQREQTTSDEYDTDNAKRADVCQYEDHMSCYRKNNNGILCKKRLNETGKEHEYL